MAKTGFKPLKGVEEGGGEGKESHTNIARPYVMPKKQYKSFLSGAPPQTPLGKLTMLPQTL